MKRKSLQMYSAEKLNLEMQNRPDLMAKFKRKPYSMDKTNDADFEKILEKELKK